MSKYSKIAPKDQEKLKEFLGDLYHYINDSDSVLDFGCSTGYFGKLLIKTKECDVNGVEIDQKDLLEARKVLGKVYSFDLDGEWPEEVYEKRYDVLFFGDVLEHLKSPEEVLRKSKKLLKNGGRILISTPNIAHISIRLELLAGQFDYESTGILDNTHIRFFTLNTLKKLAQDTGYGIQKVDYSLVDFAPTITKRLLGNIGLNPTEKFWNYISTPEARAYQYKLVLIPLKKGEKTKPLKVLDKPVSEHDKVFQSLSKERGDLRRQLEEALETLKLCDEELRQIHDSKSWKTFVSLSRPIRKVARPLKKRK